MFAIEALISVVVAIHVVVAVVTPFAEAILEFRYVLRIFERLLVHNGTTPVSLVAHVLLSLEWVFGPTIATFPWVSVLDLELWNEMMRIIVSEKRRSR